ncbi:hypothetical protein GTY86_35660 [Streptomyces sp. SID5770]|uniref:hypothetical protein n=1 Tax=Streptomyces sp. SID5770 TaxID=2690308 RepID=UPI00136A21BC|nr:hypothetical protein [Streptomyces sp. SID5770]MZE53798.1 hypothetical protein [Streptomyces sp. SID5770]MZE56513.1 hypothetical protein [Streptomyces sp. SID5770]
MHVPTPRTPLLIPATLLSAGSLAWTTWSLVDLLGAGPIGVTVAAGADLIWASVILAEARGVRVPVRGRNIVPAIGWASLVAVAALLAWHGIDRNVPAMAVGGPFLPLGTKCLWLMALADMRDPSALTDTERARLADLERGMRFEEAEHRIDLRRREMAAERLLADVSVDFEIELARQDKGRELARRAPIAIAAITPEQRPSTPIASPITPEQPQASGHPEAAPTSVIADREPKSIADLAREHVAIHPTNPAATDAICLLRPNADRPSVGAAVRRARRELDGGTYR